MREFNPTGHLGIDAEEYADFVFSNAIGGLLDKILSDIEESGISAEKATQVPGWLADAIERNNKMAMKVNGFVKNPEKKLAGQLQQS